MSFKFLDHTGDTAVEVRAADARELFCESARALAAIYVDAERGAAVERALERRVSLEAEDAESLLIDFLNELIYLFDADGFLCTSVEVLELRLERSSRLEARLEGEVFDPARHRSLTEVKAATFHGVAVEKTAVGWCATVVFDL